MFDVLKRYLLIVWNFFFGQVSTESIKDGSCPKDEPKESVDIVPPVEVDSDEGAVVNEDEEEIEDIYDDEEDEDEEDEDEDEEVEVDDDEEKVVDLPKKSEDVIIKNDVPSKPSDPTNKIEEDKLADVPKVKDNVEIKKPELPKANVVEIKDKNKSNTESDETEKKEDIKVAKDEVPKLKPEIPVKDSSKVIPEAKDTSKPELEIKEKEPSKVVPKKDSTDSKPEFEIIERKQPTHVVPEKDSADSKPEFEIIEKEGLKVAPEKDSAKSKPAETKETEAPKVTAEKEAPKPKNDVKPPHAHVKFEDEVINEKKDDGKPAVPSANSTETRVPEKPVPERAADHGDNSQFVVLEKGEAPAAHGDADGPKKTAGHSIDSFLLGEQTHSSHLLHHPESIQDQQL